MPSAPGTEIDEGRAARHAAVRAALPEHLDRRGWSSERLAARQRDALRVLLTHAVGHSAFHAERIAAAAGIDPAQVELADLPRLPTMTKAEMMASFDDVVTDRRLNRDLVEAHLAGIGSDATERLGWFMVLASGGSSGERGVFVFGRDAAVHFRLGLARNALAQALARGPLPPGGVRTAMVAAESDVHATGR